jgi:hypothetical protein
MEEFAPLLLGIPRVVSLRVRNPVTTGLTDKRVP